MLTLLVHTWIALSTSAWGATKETDSLVLSRGIGSSSFVARLVHVLESATPFATPLHGRHFHGKFSPPFSRRLISRNSSWEIPVAKRTNHILVNIRTKRHYLYMVTVIHLTYVSLSVQITCFTYAMSPLVATIATKGLLLRSYSASAQWTGRCPAGRHGQNACVL